MARLLSYSVVTILMIGGCNNDASVVGSGTGVQETYFHTTVGDTLQYGTYTLTIDSAFERNGHEYVRVSNFPTSDWSRRYAVRRDAGGNIVVVNMIDTTWTEYLLLKSEAGIGTSWAYMGGSTVTLESRTDTVVCAAGKFTGCVKVRIQWWSLEYEILWFAPGVGIVKREFDTASARPIAVWNLELSNYRLK